MAQFLEDTFSGEADGTNLTAHTGEDTGAWVKHGSYAGASQNALFASNRVHPQNFQTALYYPDRIPGGTDDEDYDVEAVVRAVSVVTNYSAGVVGRLETGADTYYMLTLEAAALVLRRRVAGVTTFITSYAFTPSAGTDYTLLLEMRGDQIRGLLDGVERIAPQTDANIAGPGRAGIRMISPASNASTTGFHIDSVNGTDLDAGGGGGTVIPVLMHSYRRRRA